MWFKSSITTPAVAAIGFCLIGGTSPAHADLGDQLFKLLAEDGYWDDWFGRSVGISGDTAIAGAHGGDDACGDYEDCNSGVAYLFDVNTGQQLFKLLADDTTMGDHLGEAVAINGTIAIAGAHGDDTNGNGAGSAYLFDTTTGRQLSKLLPADGEAQDQFGKSVAVGGTNAIVGAPLPKLVYLFDISDPQNPIEVAKLQPDDDPAGGFGPAFAISPDGFTAIVRGISDDGNGPSVGAAYLFDISDPKNPVQLFKLLAEDGEAGDGFGRSVAISGATAIVGASADDDNGEYSGSAYLFDITTGQQLFKLLPDDGEAFEFFGSSVGINGSIGVVGAPSDGDNGFESGSAYLFDISTGQQLVKLLADDGADEDWFGGSVAISGVPGSETAIVGASAPNDTGETGSAYLFDAVSAPPCPWDLDASGSVGASDLLSLLVSWGPCKGCPADFNGNGNVGASDLLVLLANWGPCP